MNRKPITLFCYCLLFICQTGLGQNFTNVSPLTGTANVMIPIYTLSSGQVAVPLSISYSGSGIKPKDVEGTAGMGWQLNAGGQISRQVRGIPDDCTFGNTGVTMLGWMSASNAGATYAGSYVIQNNGTCSTGTTDINNINNNISYNNDTEPDIFYVDAPGLSCQLVYDRASAKFHPVNYRDLVITYTVTGGSGYNASNITSFTITNDNGVTYAFAAPESVTETASAGTGNYFTTKFKQYQYGITYADSWSLTSITDANGNSIILSYMAAPVRYSQDPVELFLSGSTTPAVQYTDMQAVSPQVLLSIGTININTLIPSVYFTFTWNAAAEIVQTGQTVISSINGMGRFMQFAYSPAKFTTGGYSRYFLTNFSDYGCGTPINYQFSYNGVDVANAITTLADSTSNQLDYWGYYSSSASNSSLLPSVYVNPSTAGYPRYVVDATSSPGSAYTYSLLASATRAVTASSIVDGALSKITNIAGGNTNIIYEPNDYYDVPSGTTIKGGGIRVKQIIDSAGTGSTNNIIRNYSYLNPAGTTHAGYSSGEPITLPQFAFTIPYSGSATGQALWTAATALSGYDLSTDDHTVMYAYVKVSQTGAGSVLYNYNVPATYWNTSAGPVCSGCPATEWAPTQNYAASYTCPSTNGPIATLTYSYPFIPNPNYDFERGLPISITSYNDNGNEAGETDYTYQRSYTPSTITAFKSEDGPAGTVAKFYNRYTVYYNTSELPNTVTKKVYDAGGLNQAQSSTVSYFYNSTHHKLLTQQTGTNSDGNVINTYFTYVKDYAPNSGASNPNINGLYNLQQLNINAPVETYQQVTRSGTTVTTGAGLTLYSPSTVGSATNYLPSQQWKMVYPDGVSFNPFSINTGNQSISKSGYYYLAANYAGYDNTAHVQTVSDNYKHIQTSFYDQLTQHPTVSFSNANFNEVAYNDFDSQFAPLTSSFTITGTGSYTPVGSHAGNAAGLATTQTVSTGTITKNTTAKNYIFSIWINPSAAGTLTIAGISPTLTLNYTGTAWAYYELKIPASSIASTFTLSFTSNKNISIDDILLYPDVAEATTATYDATGHFKIAETNTNGVSSYYTNDQWGRVQYAYDQDRNIVQRKQYVSATNIRNFLAPSINGPLNVYTGQSAFFNNTSPNSCTNNGVNQISYKWDFGDGTTPIVTTSYSGQSHTYTSPNNYTITVTATSPLFGNKVGTLIVKVVNFPNVKISYTNFCTPGGHIPSAIETVNFMVGGTTVYSYSNAQLIAGSTVPPGNYTIQIIPVGTQYNSGSNPTGYGAVTYQGNASQCWNFTGSSFSITDNISYTPVIYLGIQPGNCN